MADSDQRPIHFGGVELPPLPPVGTPGREAEKAARFAVAYGNRLPPVVWSGAVGFAAGADVPDMAHMNPPAGEETAEARLVNVSRMAVAARIKHGVPLADMVDHIITLALVEERLRSYM